MTKSIKLITALLVAEACAIFAAPSLRKGPRPAFKIARNEEPKEKIIHEQNRADDGWFFSGVESQDENPLGLWIEEQEELLEEADSLDETVRRDRRAPKDVTILEVLESPVPLRFRGGITLDPKKMNALIQEAARAIATPIEQNRILPTLKRQHDDLKAVFLGYEGQEIGTIHPDPIDDHLFIKLLS
jgi:hypothetical protein